MMIICVFDIKIEILSLSETVMVFTQYEQYSKWLLFCLLHINNWNEISIIVVVLATT